MKAKKRSQTGYREWKEGILVPSAVDEQLALEERMAEVVDGVPAAEPTPPPRPAAEPWMSWVGEPSLRVYDRSALADRISELRQSLASGVKTERSRQLVALQRLLFQGPDRPLQTVGREPLKALEALRHTYPNFGEFLDLVCDHIRLARLVRPAVLRLPNICLLGPPGIGKTAVIRRVTQILGVPNRIVSCADLSAAFVVSGSTATWSSANHGFVAERFLDGSPANSCFILDEMDKLPRRSNYPADGALYRLLEPTTARQFRDEYLDIDLDASRLIWLATANERDGIPEAIRSRLTMVNVQAPGRREMGAVIDSVNEELRREEPGIAKAFARKVPTDVKELLLALPPRRLKKTLLAAYARAATAPRNGRRRVLSTAHVLLSADDTPKPPFGFLH
jgi:ATP-dependent Lon protease